MGYSAKAIANYLLDLAKKENKPLSPLKLQKLVYVAHGWHLAVRGRPLVDNEFAEAWAYGPVFPSLYHEFKDFGRQAISRRATDIQFDKGEGAKFNISLFEPTVSEGDADTKLVLDQIWSAYSKLSGLQLSDMTHREGTPWWQIRSQTAGMANADIPNEIIQDHYVDLAMKRRAAREQPEGQKA